MSATLIVVTADFRSPDGETPEGEISFDLSGTLSVPADLESIAGGQAKAGLDQGQLAVPLVANDSAGAVPSSDYWVTERIVGAAEHGYYIVVPRAPVGSRSVSDGVSQTGVNTLSSATAAFGSGDLGAYVFSPVFPVPAQVRSVISSTAVELTVAATSTSSGLTVLIRASVDLSTLRPL